ncbi:MAG TPA: hypothetical protein VFC10_17095 [Terriglobia bacterium]|nr:hypothetical protein [Terriglobia bacterium]
MAAELFVRALTWYAAVGALFAAAFVWRGVSRIDGQAAGAGLGFRLILLPGVTALWPVLLRRWIRAQS